MKLFLLFFSIFSINSLTSNQEFVDEVGLAYEEYVVLEEYHNNYYDIKVYAGKLDEEVYYGISFKNTIPNQYSVKLVINEELYKINETPRGDVFAPKIDVGRYETFSILIYSKGGQYQYGLDKFQNIKVMNLEEFNNLESKIIGSGRGITTAKISKDVNFPIALAFYLVSITIVLICFVIIFVYFKTKKGMFNKDIKSSNVFNFKEFLRSPMYDVNISQENDSEILNANIEEDKYIENEVDPKDRIVHETYVWQHYEEEKSDFNIKEYLVLKNLPINYKEATVEEKNLIMIELMNLKSNNQITKDDYLDEISELWKN